MVVWKSLTYCFENVYQKGEWVRILGKVGDTAERVRTQEPRLNSVPRATCLPLRGSVSLHVTWEIDHCSLTEVECLGLSAVQFNEAPSAPQKTGTL